MKTSAVILMIGLGIGLAGCAKPDPNSPSGKRHAAFEKIGEANKALSGIFEAATPDLAAAAGPVATLKAEVAILPSLFPKGSGPESDQPTDALADIWTKPAAFSQEMKGLAGAVSELDAALAKGDVAAASSANADLGKTCKSCHSKFRED